MNEKGFSALFLLSVTTLGIVTYLIITDTVPFKDSLFAFLYPKPDSFASLSNPISAPASPQPRKLGDLNSDDQVGIQDFSLLLSKWNTADETADLNNDGTVGIQDFAILLSNWGR